MSLYTANSSSFDGLPSPAVPGFVHFHTGFDPHTDISHDKPAPSWMKNGQWYSDLCVVTPAGSNWCAIGFKLRSDTDHNQYEISFLPNRKIVGGITFAGKRYKEGDDPSKLVHKSDLLEYQQFRMIATAGKIEFSQNGHVLMTNPISSDEPVLYFKNGTLTVRCVG
jgi:hypothetical protein